jgi:hypothetical protein
MEWWGHSGMFGGQTLWTPANTTEALWFDAADSSTITTVSGAISQWNDKSGNARNITQGTAANRPALTANGLNSLAVATFDGSNDILSTSSAGAIGVLNVSIIALFRYVSASGEDLPMGLGQTADGSKIRAFYRASGGTTQGYATWANDITASSLSTDTGGGFHIFEAVQSSNQVSLWRDGNADSVLPRTLPTTPLAIQTDAFSIGSLTGSAVATYQANIAVAEVLVFYSAISTDIRQRSEGYMAHKWGLTANLPAGHPYKSAPPYV